MRINSWWAADPAERFWMETTGRVDLGADLHAPQLNGAGRPEWGYALVAETRPGDVVFHWHKSRAGRPALVGWSVITGPLQARQYYTELGATAVEELGKPFDLIVHGLGAVRHVEVKGSTAAPLAAVELTVNEVAHAGSYQPTDLIVVDHIGLSVNATGEPTATGGRIRAWANWTPAKTALSPTRYAYELPGASRQDEEPA